MYCEVNTIQNKNLLNWCEQWCCVQSSAEDNTSYIAFAVYEVLSNPSQTLLQIKSLKVQFWYQVYD